MACNLVFSFGRYAVCAGGLGLVIGLAGCTKSEEIRQYSAPKESASDAEAGAKPPSVGESEPSDRMLAALVPHDDWAWFFKLAGPAEKVGKYADAFRSLVQSVSFAEGDKAEPQWTLPAGWERKAGSTEMRFATIELPAEGEGLEVSVVRLPWRAQAYVNMLLTNVNRWRGQMQLPPVRADVLADEFETVKLPSGDAMLVDLKGKLKTDAMQPPFAGGANGKSLPMGHPPLRPPENENQNSSGSVVGSTDGKAASASDGASSVPDANLPFTYTAPLEWTPKPPPMFAVAAFSAANSGAPVDISITPMMGPGGDVLMNINRWRGMLRLPPIKEEDLASTTKSIEIGGNQGQLVQFAAAEDASPRQAIAAAMLKAGDTTWVFRLRGSTEAVGHEEAAFEKFLASIKFREAGK